MLNHRVITLLIVALCAISIDAKTCKYTKSDFNTYWIYSNNSILLSFQNTNIKNNEWTGIGFGDNKNDFSAIIFMVENNQVTVRPGSSTEHGPPTFTSDASNALRTSSLQYFPRDKTMNAVVSIPLNLNGRSLQQCQKWRWIRSGKVSNGNPTRNDKSPKDKKVCPMECT